LRKKNKKKRVKKMKNEVRFEIPQVGSFTISTDSFKYLPPFPHCNKKEREKEKKEKDKMKEYTVWYNGCGIGGVDKIEDGYDIVKKYAEQHLKLRKAELEVDLEKVENALEVTKEFDWIQLFRKE
jgi:hypothetical protein